jgi:hypothetical protein
MGDVRADATDVINFLKVNDIELAKAFNEEVSIVEKIIDKRNEKDDLNENLHAEEVKKLKEEIAELKKQDKRSMFEKVFGKK